MSETCAPVRHFKRRQLNVSTLYKKGDIETLSGKNIDTVNCTQLILQEFEHHCSTGMLKVVVRRKQNCGCNPPFYTLEIKKNNSSKMGP